VWALLLGVAIAYDSWAWALVAAVAIVLTHIATPTESAPRYGLDHEFAVDAPEFLATMAGATGESFTGGNRLTILNNGDEFFPAMLDEIQRAERSVTIEAYIYWAGEIGVTFARALAAKRRSGVVVKILLDAVGASAIGEDILKILEAGGCQVAWYNPVRWYSLGRLNHRTHRKSLIVDGCVGFTGGAGIADQWCGHAQDPEHWRDIQVRLEGPAVAALQTGFAQNWLQTTGELVTGPVYYPERSPAGSLDVQTLLSSPEAGASTVRIMYYLSIVCARKSILIANPYFVPDDIALLALRAAQRRGVDVQIMVAGRHNDNWWARYNSIRLYGPLLKAGVVILEYDKTMLHQKTMIVDGVWATVGTTNFDNRSFALNDESNVCIYNRSVAKEFERIFRADAEACHRIELAAWRRRGAWSKAQELIASFLQDQA
jgi:cardiolipin synthase